MAGTADNVLDVPTFDDPVKVLVVTAPYYGTIAGMQLDAVRAVLDRAGATHDVVEVPGSLEVPPAIAIAHRQADYDAYVALGCVIRGATSHYDLVVNESARGITTLTLMGACVGNGIITVEDMDQALERADGARLDTAGHAANAALHLLKLARTLKKDTKGIGFRAGS
ncbi:6,7-dimethyl-8-ribityllumazine synthase [Jannaschia sp. LMIT008]|uniref:6,7-dimethyl-8-ribityllumazine synthase n=1 Tax=Jannaschia maritima TaxID=3032585 RepID=UPI002810B1CB|nr:6,7-dimethyl-8-ribityllumazine synthase [Jannaschia sp. LMIT008]